MLLLLLLYVLVVIGLFTVPIGGATIEEPLAITGSSSTYIVGFCEAEYREDMQQCECVTFVQKALELAWVRVAGSGGIVVPKSHFIKC
jgi:20S proteasome subunit beta 1